ncbi:tail fiber/spike domain-containing protein [Scandinavium manionii]|uniref:tail fiber/spike domain-containing protein n=1 Tax=Scandinavium manionii TaxID=2926520 RepID=UPI0021666FEF|nr:hypothetical protein [Scandinavium manionii]MCS2167528.1 hypothetical protein [Scandinavium manionii]
MATQPTNLPVPSESPRDLKFNAGKIDEFVTSLVNTYVDRLGNQHYTIEGLSRLVQEAIDAYGYITMDSFQDGATLTLPNQVLRWKLPDGDGEYYRWDGSLPKTVAAGSSPATTGGVGSGAWLSVGDGVLRTELNSNTGEPIVSLHKVKAVPQGNLSQMFPYFTPEQFVNPGETFKDGVNDDAVQINRALDYAESIGGGVVLLSKGDHYQNTQVLVPENCTLRGSGMFATMLNAMNTMDKTLNSITSKNNLMYLQPSGAEHPDYTDYTYISGVVIEDLGVNANHLGRDPSRSGLPTTVQSCGIKLTSVKNSIIRRCYVTHGLLHCFDVAAMTYFNDGNYTHNIAGGSDEVLIEGCFGENALYDDVFTCHNSTRITFRDCDAVNDGTDPNMLWEINQNGFEVDEGCDDVLVDNCRAKYFIAGFQVKGHDTTMPARNVTLRKCHAIDCVWSYQIEHLVSNLGVLSRNVVLDQCISENAYNDRYMPSNPTYRPRAAWLRGYQGIAIRDFVVIGGKGLVELDGGADSVSIDGLTWKGGYSGIYQGLDTAGLINVQANQTKGRHSFKNIYIADAVTTPVVRCVDNTLTGGINVSNVIATGSAVPCLMITCNIPNNIDHIVSNGFTMQMKDSGISGGGSIYPNDLTWTMRDGLAVIRTPGVPNGTLHPSRVGNQAISRDTGKIYYALGTAVNTTGTWATATP